MREHADKKHFDWYK